MKKNKRGLSPVIATVLTIMLTVAAVAALAAFVVPFVRDSLQRSSECLDYGSYYVFEESGYNCNTENVYALSVKASFDKELAESVAGFKIIFNDASGATRQAEVRTGAEASSISIMGDSSGVLRTPGAGGVVTYVYSAAPEDSFISAEVYPIVKSGRICGDVKETVKIIECSGDKKIG